MTAGAIPVIFEASGRGAPLLARATVTRRAQTLCFVSVAVEDPKRAPVAHALITYRLG